MYYHGIEATIIKPGNVFGDGNHESTQMVLEALYQQKPKGKTILDIGTGTGIQSIFAVKWGAKSATAVDIDAACIYTARKNFAKNDVEVFSRLNIYNEYMDEKYDITIANLPAGGVVEFVPMASKTMAEDGVLIFSWDRKLGIHEARLEEHGLEIADHYEGIEWDSYAVRRIK